MNQYTVLGRKIPTEAMPNPEIFKMTIFAQNEMVAESRFWVYLNQLQKIKRTHGQTVSVQQVIEEESTVKNYGIQLRFRDQIGHHNMYREARETTAARAMAKMYSEMAGQYHCRYQDIQIIKFEVIANFEDIRRQKIVMMTPHAINEEHNHEVKFPHPFAQNPVKRAAKSMRFAKKIPVIEV
ncbi:Ribosomal_protein L18a [Hexamita inflata]|uniref:60S ribosomal protein L18a n=1 Tax=Hexamita inflata TaxID=28002 RepID=A0AA86PL07_9EUKA|nr:Ribosomal protein L18a [Hexamita inflata]CAI9929703.1 Ribosomal protein L18a [Hexamita inflata]CAI9941671.1 Ribosomal protein L18a [Hexamita inflata]CAI9941684.1 Ribosomal protein L18a [Hexamita inflata]CAI9944750.1 Ribosomal protein L18a [Hexamita inflata]